MAFVGRARALSRLLAVEEASSGRARLVLVAGEAGIGKTTLIGEATAHSGLLVGWGACAEAERMPAFWPWTVALRGLLSALDRPMPRPSPESTRPSWPGCFPSWPPRDPRSSTPGW
jgi:predicted ATPase